MIERLNRDNSKAKNPGAETDFSRISSNYPVTIVDYLKSIGRDFVIAGLYLKVMQKQITQFFTGKNSSDSIANLKHRINHLKIDDQDLYFRSTYKEKLIVTARNVVSMEIFTKGEIGAGKNEGIRGKHSSNSSLSNVEFQSKFDDVSRGICFGGCLEFAKAMLDNGNPRVIAAQFKAGMGTNAIAYQRFQQREDNTEITSKDTLHYLETAGEINAEDKKTVEDLLFLALHIQGELNEGHSDSLETKVFSAINRSFKNKTPPSQNILDAIQEDKSKAAEWLRAHIEFDRNQIDGQFFRINYLLKAGKRRTIQGLFSLHRYFPSRFNDESAPDSIEAKVTEALNRSIDIKTSPSQNLLDAIQGDESEAAEWLRAYIAHYGTRIDEKFFRKHKFFQRVKKFLITIGKKAKNLINMKQKKICLLTGIQQRVYLGRKFNHAAEKAGLSLTPMKGFDNTGRKNDEAFLTPLSTIEEGVYQLTIQVESSSHSALFINNGGNKYFWDPNFGLFQLDQNYPKKTILKILSNYSCPHKKGHHDLQINQVLPLKTV